MSQIISNDISVLIVDDDQEIRQLLSEFLESNGLTVLQAADGTQMFEQLRSNRVDIITLDLNLPGTDGVQLCRELRGQNAPPVIMVTARTHPIDRVLGLETGADDYVCKPFEPFELLSRIRTVLRRTQAGAVQAGDNTAPAHVQFSGWTLDTTARHLINPQGVVVSLSGAEYRLLTLFIEHANRILSRDQLMDWVHGRDAGPFDRSIDLQVSRLRQKIEEDSKNPQIIKTVRNEGYILATTVKSASAHTR